ncbi:MAG: hypothetical protein WBL84_01395, partial [Xanthobacteraceae bacterium]
MPSLAEDYRVKASECAELATKTKDPRSKRVLEQTAEAWSALADVLKARTGEKVGATENGRTTIETGRPWAKCCGITTRALQV